MLPFSFMAHFEIRYFGPRRGFGGRSAGNCSAVEETLGLPAKVGTDQNFTCGVCASSCGRATLAVRDFAYVISRSERIDLK